MTNAEQRVAELKKARLRAVAIVFSVLGIAIAALLYPEIRKSMEGEEVEIDPLSAARAQREDLHIGVLLPLQGELQAYGESIKRGASAAAHEINTGPGILGKNIKLHFADTRSMPGLTAELTADLIRRVKVSLIIGTASDEEALAAIPVATAAKTPFIYLGNGSLKTCKAENNREVSDYVWGAGLTPQMTVEPFLIHLADKLRKPETRFRLYYFGTDDEESRQESAFVIRNAESLGFETVAEEFVDVRITDYFQRIRRIFGLAPDALIVTTSRRGSPIFMRQAAKLGVKAEMAVAGLRPFEQEVVQTLGAALDGIYTAARYTENLENETNHQFLSLWRELYPQAEIKPTAIAVAGAYTAIKVAATAWEKAESTDPEAFRSAMSELEVEVPQGRVIVSGENNLFVQPLYAVRIKDGEYAAEEYLGDVSHPGLKSCAIASNEHEVQTNTEAVN